MIVSLNSVKFSTSDRMDEIIFWNPNFYWVCGSQFGVLNIWWIETQKGTSSVCTLSVPLVCNKTFPVSCGQDTGKPTVLGSGSVHVRNLTPWLESRDDIDTSPMSHHTSDTTDVSCCILWQSKQIQAHDVQKQGLQRHNITLYLQLLSALPPDLYRWTPLGLPTSRPSPITPSSHCITPPTLHCGTGVADPLEICSSPTCCTAEFGRSRSNGTNIIK